MGVKEVIQNIFFDMGLSSEGLFDDWRLAIILLALLTMLFGHSLEKSLEKKHLFSYSLGFLLAIFPVVIIFFLFHLLELYFNVESELFYNSTFIVLIFVAFKRLFEHMKKRKNF